MVLNLFCLQKGFFPESLYFNITTFYCTIYFGMCSRESMHHLLQYDSFKLFILTFIEYHNGTDVLLCVWVFSSLLFLFVLRDKF